MLVSCICVCHNKPDLAHEAVQSIVDQSYPHWQALVVDSGVLYDRGYYDQFSWRHDPRIQFVRSEETPAFRKSKAMAPWCFNECFRKGLVRGDLVIYLCDDDILYPNAFQTFVSYATQHPNAQAMYASQDIGAIYPNGRRAIVGERLAAQRGGKCCNGRIMDCQVDYLQFCHKREILSLFPHDEYWPECKETEAHADGLFMERIGAHVPIYPIDVKVSQNRRTPRSLNDPSEATSPLDGDGSSRLAERCRVLRKQAERWHTEAESWRQQYILNRSFLHSLRESLVWKLLKPLRFVRRMLRPRGFGVSALLPWRQLERDLEAGPNSWIATGPQAAFIVPCELSAGWYRLRASLTSNRSGWFEVIAKGGDGISDIQVLFHAKLRRALDEDRCVYLSRAMIGLQINPLNRTGRFEMNAFEITPLPWCIGQTNAQAESVPRVSPRPRAKRCGEICGTDCDSEYPDLELSDELGLDWSIVIPTVNDVRRVVKCVSTCREHLELGLNVEFLVVDDGTRERSTLQLLELESARLGFRILRNYQNLGFSASVNHGMRCARGRYIALCNNDIVFRQPILGALTRTFETHTKAGVVGCKLIYPRGTIQHVGMDKVPGQLRWNHTFHDYPANHPAACTSRYVWSVTGALCALRRSTLQQLGGFSTAYTMAYEDLDYCLRAWAKAVRVYYCAEAVAVHEESGTLGRSGGERKKRPLVWSMREQAGRRYFERKWRRLRQIESFEELCRAESDA